MTQQPQFYKNPALDTESAPDAMRYWTQLSFWMTVLLCLGTQGIALLIFFRRRELRIDGDLLLYVLTFLISLPGLVGFQTYRRVKRRLLTAGTDPKTVSSVLYLILQTIGTAYLFLMFSQMFILNALRWSNKP
jgi:hypothetical protein